MIEYKLNCITIGSSKFVIGKNLYPKTLMNLFFIKIFHSIERRLEFFFYNSSKISTISVGVIILNYS